jgi:hypothetical protein
LYKEIIDMLDYFPKATIYLRELNIQTADKLDQKAWELIQDENIYERASQALRRRFVRGAEEVEGVDKGGRRTKIKRERQNGKYAYFIQGLDGNWFEPEERIWVVASYALWQDTK